MLSFIEAGVFSLIASHEPCPKAMNRVRLTRSLKPFRRTIESLSFRNTIRSSYTWSNLCPKKCHRSMVKPAFWSCHAKKLHVIFCALWSYHDLHLVQQDTRRVQIKPDTGDSLLQLFAFHLDERVTLGCAATCKF